MLVRIGSSGYDGWSAKLMRGRGGARLVAGMVETGHVFRRTPAYLGRVILTAGPVAYDKTEDSAGTAAASVRPALPWHPPQRVATRGGHDRSGARPSASGAAQCPLHPRSRARYGSFRVPGCRLERVQGA